ncbi:MAG: septal ring lytic transglycosylase RlpA family protein [Paludibacter sp.]|nr:septal ring lytic transglycosylase RlpA family protein [Paludibacter sp.]
MKKIIQLIVFILFLTFTSTVAQKTGKASFYSSKLQGRHTSDGGKYHPDSLTCAHLTYPFGTLLKVRNPKNDKEVIVKVTDRGPHTRNRLIDLSYSAAKQLDIVRNGIATVEITKLDYYPILLSLIPIPRVLLSVQDIYEVTDLINSKYR